ncbi:hypothetical protein BDW42DRAFT_173632 [Aspergillus taichungensis]|uniref:Uncharacterized protein n=1 Tax=Aspergillus taichungensis TaxID=482145 RepID=A0A2J5HPG1_9EURO|nr:hypothetical protein BDW42DRAFT_173632 [Aspergillus taichungensis]
MIFNPFFFSTLISCLYFTNFFFFSSKIILTCHLSSCVQHRHRRFTLLLVSTTVRWTAYLMAIHGSVTSVWRLVALFPGVFGVSSRVQSQSACAGPFQLAASK